MHPPVSLAQGNTAIIGRDLGINVYLEALCGQAFYQAIQQGHILKTTSAQGDIFYSSITTGLNGYFYQSGTKTIMKTFT